MIGLDWLIVILILAALAYAAWVIKNEKITFFKNSIPYQIGPFLLKTPHWWSIKERGQDRLIFERKDTKYDWFSSFAFIKDPVDNLEGYLINFVKNKKIIFDPETSDITSNSEMVGISGTATEDGIERIYYEITILKSDKGILVCESKSSVLNGGVEGPYFEEVVKGIKLV